MERLIEEQKLIKRNREAQSNREKSVITEKIFESKEKSRKYEALIEKKNKELEAWTSATIEKSPEIHGRNVKSPLWKKHNHNDKNISPLISDNSGNLEFGRSNCSSPILSGMFQSQGHTGWERNSLATFQRSLTSTPVKNDHNNYSRENSPTIKPIFPPGFSQNCTSWEHNPTKWEERTQQSLIKDDHMKEQTLRYTNVMRNTGYKDFSEERNYHTGLNKSEESISSEYQSCIDYPIASKKEDLNIDIDKRNSMPEINNFTGASRFQYTPRYILSEKPVVVKTPEYVRVTREYVPNQNLTNQQVMTPRGQANMEILRPRSPAFVKCLIPKPQ